MKPLVFVGIALHRQCSWVTRDDASLFLLPLPAFTASCTYRNAVWWPKPQASPLPRGWNSTRTGGTTEVHHIVAKAASHTTMSTELHADNGWYDGVVQSSNRQWWATPDRSSMPQLKEADQQRQKKGEKKEIAGKNSNSGGNTTVRLEVRALCQ